MNITNRIENILIAAGSALVAVLLTIFILHMTSIASLKQEIKRQYARIEKQDAIIVDLAKIEKYKIENRFDKVKAKDGQIVLSLDNKLSAMHFDSIQQQQKKPPDKRTFWQKLRFW